MEFFKPKLFIGRSSTRFCFILGSGLTAVICLAATEPLFPPFMDVETQHLASTPPLTWLKDPFRKIPGLAAPVEREDEPHLTLEGVVSSGEEQLAIINGKEYHLEDEVGNRLVSEIGENYVLLEDGNSTIELMIPMKKEPQGSIRIIESNSKERGL